MAVLSYKKELVRHFWRIFLFGTTFVRLVSVTTKMVLHKQKKIINKYKLIEL